MQDEVCGIEHTREVVVYGGITATHKNTTIREHMPTRMADPGSGRGGEHLISNWSWSKWIVKKRIKNGVLGLTPNT